MRLCTKTQKIYCYCNLMEILSMKETETERDRTVLLTIEIIC